MNNLIRVLIKEMNTTGGWRFVSSCVCHPFSFDGGGVLPSNHLLAVRLQTRPLLMSWPFCAPLTSEVLRAFARNMKRCPERAGHAPTAKSVRSCTTPHASSRSTHLGPALRSLPPPALNREWPRGFETSGLMPPSRPMALDEVRAPTPPRGTMAWVGLETLCTVHEGRGHPQECKNLGFMSPFLGNWQIVATRAKSVGDSSWWAQVGM